MGSSRYCSHHGRTVVFASRCRFPSRCVAICRRPHNRMVSAWCSPIDRRRSARIWTCSATGPLARVGSALNAVVGTTAHCRGRSAVSKTGEPAESSALLRRMALPGCAYSRTAPAINAILVLQTRPWLRPRLTPIYQQLRVVPTELIARRRIAESEPSCLSLGCLGLPDRELQGQL